ncbi:MAG: MFS transporter [Dehalococcoidia bacterium]
MRRSLELNIRLFYIYRFLRDAQVWIPVWVVFLTVEQGFSLAEVTAADGLYFLATVFLEVPTGAVADRWGRSLSVGLGCLVMVVALGTFAFATTFAVMLASFMLWALAAALMSGADLALLYDSLQAIGREDEYERHAGRGEAAVWIGVAAATSVGGPLAVLTSLRFTVFVGMAVYLVAASVAFLMVEAPHRSASGVVTRYFGNMTQAFRIAWRDEALRWLVAFGGLIHGAMGAAMYFVQPLLLDRGVEVGPAFSSLQVVPWLAAALGAFMVASVLRRVGEATVLCVLATGGVAAYVGLATVPTLAAFAFVPVLALLESTIIPLTTGYVNRRVPSEQRATVLSLESLSRGLFIAPLGPLAGAVADREGLPAAFAMLGAALAVGALILGPVWLRAHRRAASVGAPALVSGAEA